MQALPAAPLNAPAFLLVGRLQVHRLVDLEALAEYLADQDLDLEFNMQVITRIDQCLYMYMHIMYL